MQNDTSTSDRPRSNEERDLATQRTSSISGVDLNHPPREIENLPDTSKRFLAGMIREGYTQGLEACNRGVKTTDQKSRLRFADTWIASNVPFLQGVIGDVDQGGSSNR